jgi:hypothetical protein
MYITITFIGRTVPATHGSFCAYNVSILHFITALQETVHPQSTFDQRSPFRINIKLNTPMKGHSDE